MNTTYNLHTEAGDKLNGTTYTNRDEMLEAVRNLYGASCDFGITEGTIVNETSEELVATFGEAGPAQIRAEYHGDTRWFNTPEDAHNWLAERESEDEEG